MPNCLECFCESGHTGQALQRLVADIHPNFHCEGERCSPFSKGPVAADEKLAFILIDPAHYDPVRGVVVPDAFQELTRRDLSTLRIAIANQTEANLTRDKLIARAPASGKMRSVSEVCIAEVQEIRSASDDAGRVFAVYDTALDEVPAHASIFTRPDVLDQRQVRKRARQKIHEIFTKQRMPYDQFIAGLKAA